MSNFYNNYLIHYGVKGMKWGVRRYQNEDGSLTSAGKERYYSKDEQRQLYEYAKKSTDEMPALERAVKEAWLKSK